MIISGIEKIRRKGFIVVITYKTGYYGYVFMITHSHAHRQMYTQTCTDTSGKSI